MFWERSNFCLKSWGTRTEAELYKLLIRLPVCWSGEESHAYLGYCSQWQGERQTSYWMGGTTSLKTGSNLNLCKLRQANEPPGLDSWHLTVHSYKHSLSISCMYGVGWGAAGVRGRMKDCENPIHRQELPTCQEGQWRGWRQRERENLECRLWEMLR